MAQLVPPPKEGFLNLFAQVPMNLYCPTELAPAVRSASYTQPEPVVHSAWGRQSWRPTQSVNGMVLK